MAWEAVVDARGVSLRERRRRAAAGGRGAREEREKATKQTHTT